jgi:hypothetical protein
MAVVTARDLISEEAVESTVSTSGGEMTGGFPVMTGILPLGSGSTWNDLVRTSRFAAATAARDLPPCRVDGDSRKRAIVMFSAGISVLAALWLIVTTIKDPTYPRTVTSNGPIDGLTIFAIFFVAAFAIERLLQPLSMLLIPKQKTADDISTSRDEAKDSIMRFGDAVKTLADAEIDLRRVKASQVLGSSSPPPDQQLGMWNTAVAEDSNERAGTKIVEEETKAEVKRAEAQIGAADQRTKETRAIATDKLNQMATSLAAHEDRNYVRTVLFWATATIIAMLGSAALRLYFLQSVSISSTSRGLEILATGLIIGAGTKPLHDLTAAIGT